MSAALWDEPSDQLWARYLTQLGWVGYSDSDTAANSDRLERAEQKRADLVAHLDATGRHPGTLSTIDRAALRAHLVELVTAPSVQVSEEIIEFELGRLVSDRAPRRSLVQVCGDPARFDFATRTTTQAATISALAAAGFADTRVHVPWNPGEPVRVWWETPELGPTETDEVAARLTEAVLATGIVDSGSVSVTTDRIWARPWATVVGE